MSIKPLVALVGRPNVGKSTLFNRIVGRRVAVVSDKAGTTRDRLYADSEWGGVPFSLVDTGGIEVTTGWHTEPLSEDSERFLPHIRQQAAIAIQDAEVVVLVVDGQVGITAATKRWRIFCANPASLCLWPRTNWNQPSWLKMCMNFMSWHWGKCSPYPRCMGMAQGIC